MTGTGGLQAGEQHVRKVSRSAWGFLGEAGSRCWLPALLLLALGGLGWMAWAAEQEGALPLLLWVAVAAALWLLLALFLSWRGNRSTHWTLTTERLIRTTGIFSQRTDYMELYRVQDLWVDSPFPLSLLGCGYVRIISSDKTDPLMFIGPVVAPEALAEAMRPHVEASRLRAGVREVDTNQSSGDRPPT